MPIERLDLSSRTLNCLKRAKLDRVGQVLDLSADELLNIRNFGQKSLEELQGKLAELGVSAPRSGEGFASADPINPEDRDDYLRQPDSGLVFAPEEDDEDDYDYDDDGA